MATSTIQGGVRTTTIENTTYRTGVITFYKRNGVVSFSSTGDFKQLPAGSYVELGTLPLEFRPPTMYIYRVATNTALIRFQVESNGKVRAFSGQAFTSATNGAICGSYVTLN